MDPNATLKEILELVQKLDRDEDQFSQDVSQLCALIEGLDNWLSRGGFLPRRWRVIP